jgi:hypothetical protein
VWDLGTDVLRPRGAACPLEILMWILMWISIQLQDVWDDDEQSRKDECQVSVRCNTRSICAIYGTSKHD